MVSGSLWLEICLPSCGLMSSDTVIIFPGAIRNSEAGDLLDFSLLLAFGTLMKAL